jgi:hypothetical protein
MSIFNVAEAWRALRKPAGRVRWFGAGRATSARESAQLGEETQQGGGGSGGRGSCHAILRAMQWEADAEARVKRAPFFVRPFIRSRAEKEARSRGLAQVTTTLLDELKASEHKPQDPSGSV